MTIKILASADYHLGMRFAGYPEVQGELADARFRALERLVDTANREGCALFIVAGDLFDRISVSQRDIERAAGLLAAFQGELVAVLPGNHDFLSGNASSLWDRFRERAADRILFLDSRRVYDLSHYNLSIRLYPGPCDSKHGNANAVSWIAPLDSPASAEKKTIHIGVAHGSIEGISPDVQGVYFPMSREQLLRAGLDFWIVGHTHRQHPAGTGATNKKGSDRGDQPLSADDPILIPGTPEPDGFDCRYEGTAWLISIEENGRISRRSLSTGLYRFIQEEILLEQPQDVAALARRFRSQESNHTLWRLTLKGRLPAELLGELRLALSEAQRSLFWLRIDDSRVTEEISADTVEARFVRGSFPYQLLKTLIDQGDTEALQCAYDLLQEVLR